MSKLAKTLEVYNEEESLDLLLDLVPEWRRKNKNFILSYHFLLQILLVKKLTLLTTIVKR